MASYAFMNPVLPGKVDEWKKLISEIVGPRSKEWRESRAKLGLTLERVWLQQTPGGDFAVVYWEAEDIGRVFEGLMKSEAAFDKWFRDDILIGIHGMDFSKPLPPLNEMVLDSLEYSVF